MEHSTRKNGVEEEGGSSLGAVNQSSKGRAARDVWIGLEGVRVRRLVLRMYPCTYQAGRRKLVLVRLVARVGLFGSWDLGLPSHNGQLCLARLVLVCLRLGSLFLLRGGG